MKIICKSTKKGGVGGNVAEVKLILQVKSSVFCIFFRVSMLNLLLTDSQIIAQVFY